jgi:hypothetical protein
MTLSLSLSLVQPAAVAASLALFTSVVQPWAAESERAAAVCLRCLLELGLADSAILGRPDTEALFSRAVLGCVSRLDVDAHGVRTARALTALSDIMTPARLEQLLSSLVDAFLAGSFGVPAAVLCMLVCARSDAPDAVRRAVWRKAVSEGVLKRSPLPVGVTRAVVGAWSSAVAGDVGAHVAMLVDLLATRCLLPRIRDAGDHDAPWCAFYTVSVLQLARFLFADTQLVQLSWVRGNVVRRLLVECSSVSALAPLLSALVTHTLPLPL